MAIPWFLPFVRGWRYHVPQLQTQLLSGVPVSFNRVYTILSGEFPGYFVSAAVGTTDPNFIVRAIADGLTVIEVTAGDMRDARVYRNQMGEPNILTYAAYIRQLPLPVYAVSLNGDGLPFYKSIELVIIPRNTPALITGFAANIIEIYNPQIFKEDLRKLNEETQPQYSPQQPQPQPLPQPQPQPAPVFTPSIPRGEPAVSPFFHSTRFNSTRWAQLGRLEDN